MAKTDLQDKTNLDYTEVVFSWYFDEFEKHERGKLWYIVMGVIVLALFVYCIYTFNFLFLVVIVLAVFIFYLYHIKEVERIKFKITDLGLVVDNNFYRWKDIKKFYIIYEPPKVKNLYFEFKSSTKPILVIPLEDEDPLKVRAYLLQVLSEDLEQESEPLEHTMGRELKF